MVYIIGGVAGSGKTTIGKLLAVKLGLPFHDADDYHSRENIQKLASGIPLSDRDRISWLRGISSRMILWDKSGGCVLACSALKEFYRNLLTPIASEHVQWIILEGDKELIVQRIRLQDGGIAREAILDSQFDIFERPKYGLFFNIKNKPEVIVTEIIRKIKSQELI